MIIDTETFGASEDDALLAGVRDGDIEAFSGAVSRHLKAVHSVSFRILKDEGLAEDVAQETFIYLFKNAQRVRRSLPGWLYRVASRRSIDLVRQETARRRREAVYGQQTLEDPDRYHQLHAVVRDALQSLRADARDFLIKHYVEGWTTAQIAQQKGLSQPTVSRRLFESLQALRQVLRQQGVTLGLIPLHSLLAETAPGSLKAAATALYKATVLPLYKLVVSLGEPISGSVVAKTAIAGTGAALAILNLGLVINAEWTRRHPPSIALPPVPRDATMSDQLSPNFRQHMAPGRVSLIPPDLGFREGMVYQPDLQSYLRGRDAMAEYRRTNGVFGARAVLANGLASSFAGSSSGTDTQGLSSARSSFTSFRNRGDAASNYSGVGIFGRMRNVAGGRTTTVISTGSPTRLSEAEWQARKERMKARSDELRKRLKAGPAITFGNESNRAPTLAAP